MDDFYKFFLEESERLAKERELTAIKIEDISQEDTSLDHYYSYQVAEPDEAIKDKILDLLFNSFFIPGIVCVPILICWLVLE